MEESPDSIQHFRLTVKEWLTLIFAAAIQLCALCPTVYAQNSPEAKPAGGNWFRVAIADQLTGAHSIHYVIHATNPAPDGGITRDPTIQIGCTGNGKIIQATYMTSTVVHAGPTTSVLGDLPQAVVSFRADGGKIDVGLWNIAADYKSLYMDKKGIESVVWHDQVIIRFSAISGYDVTDTFDTSGLNRDMLEADCGKIKKH